MRNVNNPVRDVNEDHLHAFVRTFDHDQYQDKFEIISLTIEKEDVSHGPYTNISELCEAVDGRP